MSTCSNSARHQRGDVLLEALVGVLITSLIGAGLAGVTARVLNSQHDAAVGAVLVNEMRNVLQINGVDLCGDDAPLENLNGLPEGLKESVTLKLGASGCGAGVSQSVTLGASSFSGIMPPEVAIDAEHEGNIYTVRTVVAPVTAGVTP